MALPSQFSRASRSGANSSSSFALGDRAFRWVAITSVMVAVVGGVLLVRWWAPPGPGAAPPAALGTSVVREPIAAPAAPSRARQTVDTPSEDVTAVIDNSRKSPVQGRAQLTALLSKPLVAQDVERVLAAIRDVNAVLFFSTTAFPGDQFARTYIVKSGDSLAKIAKSNGMSADWRLVQRLNGLKSERAISVGQRLKLPIGCFHAEIDKSSYTMFLFVGDGESRELVATFPVGVGELDSTPVGAFIVRPGSKLIDPEWKHPRTGEYYAANDPDNPIGERWIGLLGTQPHNTKMTGYGIHGTTDLDSIGKQKSLGCVRMRGADLELVFEALTEPGSTIVIHD